jgi:RimJ/RimL family protein N-acetyltransferase
MSTPTQLTKDGVHIRPFTASDADALHDAVAESINDLSPWLDWARDGYTLSDARAWVRSRSQAWARKEAYSFAVVDAGSGRFLGGVGLNRIDSTHGTGNLGYWTRSSETGRGVASTAAALAARFGLDTVGLHRVEILVPSGNAPSRAVARNAGAVREGTLRNRLVIADEVHDAECFSIVE